MSDSKVDRTSFVNHPHRLAVMPLLEKLFSRASRPAKDILETARQALEHPGIDFVKAPVPYLVTPAKGEVLEGYTMCMKDAVACIVVDLENLPPDSMVIVDIDVTRLRNFGS